MKKSTFKKFVAFALVVMMLASTCVINFASAANLTITFAPSAENGTAINSASADASVLTDGVKEGGYNVGLTVITQGSDKWTDYNLAFASKTTIDTIVVYAASPAGGGSWNIDDAAESYKLAINGEAVSIESVTVDRSADIYAIATIKFAAAEVTTATLTIMNNKYMAAIYEIEAINSADAPVIPDEPSADEPSADEPSADEPSADEPSADEPSADEPSADEPSADEPSADEPSADEPSADEPSADEPSADEPSADEPSADEPSADEPSADEPSSEEPEVKDNYALNKDYVLEGALGYLSGRGDNGVILTDGIVPDAEINGQTVAFEGTGAINTIIINLGKVYKDINEIVVAGVRVAGNRQYANVVIEVSKNGKDYTVVENAAFTETEIATGTFNMSHKFDDVAAQYVKVTFTSSNYVLTVGDVQVYGSGNSDNTLDEKPVEPGKPGDVGFAVVALVAMISLAGAVIVSKRKFN